ncbi:NAD(P)/FAD-dependent oxidoreductase [Arthrobacter sp. ISL-72]|uniref:FAD-dependent oxidoreductase n=1 Tax=Arthrobacter sp. ISL-72 TaxID=2819114 RepID=UPI001BEBA70F|nr:NAD(P)/FAD-dependent oxidoreductase [Arthrobacter sp. ISL-72]MBT2595037.1 FAD-dependent monooxygenase [Arthrobacter sp. ISL-72]
MIDVVVVGGGPVGLFMAALLLQHGVSVRVLEQRAEPNPHSRAIGIHPPSLEALDGVGVAAALTAGGVQIRRGLAIGGGAEVAAMSFDGVSGRYPFVLSLPQARTEAVLERRVMELDSGSLQRGVTVTGLHDDGGTVAVDVVTAGQEARIYAALAVAADGVRSTVRQLLGVPATFREYPDAYLMGDFADSTAFGADAALFLERPGIVESFPLPGGVRRWVARLPAAGTEPPTAASLANMVGERTGIAVDAGSNSMLSMFGVRSRLAQRMVRGRTALIGDAAHEISPIGGQGMNLGWLDAAELAPLILSRLGQRATERDLACFESHRLQAAARASRQAEINMALGRPLPTPLWHVRNRLIGFAGGTPAINSRVAARFTMH